jgi:serine/threonine protein phosphatase PrpC
VKYKNKGLALRLTHDHKGSDQKERKRIRDLGGFVSEKGRVMGDVAVSRALGDCQYNPFVSTDPFDSNEQQDREPFILYQGSFISYFFLFFIFYFFSFKGDFLIIGCDGIWDEVSDLEAVSFIHNYLENGGSKEHCAAALRDFTFSLGSKDNISVIVVFYEDIIQEKDK